MNHQPDFQAGPLRQALEAWHQSLEERKGDRARLRRASEPMQVAWNPAYHALRQRMERISPHLYGPTLEAVAGLAAIVRHNDAGMSLARQMASSVEGGRPRVSEARFRRLLRHESPADLYGPLGRILRLMGERANLADLAASVYYWGPKVRRRWAYDYYETARLED